MKREPRHTWGLQRVVHEYLDSRLVQNSFQNAHKESINGLKYLQIKNKRLHSAAPSSSVPSLSAQASFLEE